MINELPQGWTEAELSMCVDNLDYMRVPVNSEDRSKRLGKIPYYGATGRVGWIDDFLFDEELLLIGEDGAPFLDKSKPISYIVRGRSWVNNHAHVLRAKVHITCNRYLMYFFNSFDFQDYVNGTTRLKLTQGAMNQIPVRLAPSAEQHRIVAKLQDLLKRTSDSQERLDRVAEILERFRKSVLRAAFSGSLTADWRNENRSDLQVDSILASIQHRQSLSAKTVTQKEKMRAIFSALEDGNADELPDNWRFVRLNKLVTSFDYGTSAKSKRSGKIPVLRMGNLQGGVIDWSDLAYTSDAAEISQYSLSPQTVLFNRTNSPELVGKTAIYRGERPAIFAGYLIRINPYAELNAEYLNLCLNTSYAREFCASVKTDGVSQSNINAQKLGTFEVPFCHPAEQEEIVRRVEGLFSLADKIEAGFKVVQRQVDRLPQSILAKAFRGELVPTDAELAEREDRPYESAEQLLERVRTAKPEMDFKGRNGQNKLRRHP